jgi:hypothetical protein
MAFLPYSTDVDKTLPNEELPAVAGDYRIGQALYFLNGKLTTASDTNVARFICVQQATGHPDGGMLAVHKIDPDVRYQTTAPFLPTVGNGYDVAADGLGLDAASQVSPSAGNFIADKSWMDVNGVFWVIGRFGEGLSVRVSDIETRLDALEA